MAKRRSSQEIDDAAAEWAARVDRGALTAEEEAALETWLAGDSRHLGAYAKARAVSVRTERARALGPAFDPAVFAPRQRSTLSRRRLLAIVGAAMAAGVSAITIGLVPQLAGRQFSTSLGETRVVSLEDGSVITLNTASRVIVKYTDERRHVELLQGEALFDVAKNPTRPFIVAASDTEVRAVGTSFTIKWLHDKPMQVLVREGVVEVKRTRMPAAPIVRVAANSRVVAPEHSGTATHPVPPAEVSRELAWRVGRIAFEGETLQEAAEMFARYSETRIVIDDPRIANQTITGLFVSNDPVGFAKAVAISLNLHAQVGSGQVRLSR
jgi:transmembrane sensor